MHLSCTTEFSDFSAVNMGSRSINVIILICTYASVIEQNNAILNKWLDDSCYFPGENFGYSISTVTRKFSSNFFGYYSMGPFNNFVDKKRGRGVSKKGHMEF